MSKLIDRMECDGCGCIDYEGIACESKLAYFYLLVCWLVA